MELCEYKQLIKKATTKEELHNITYNCLLEESQNINSKKYNQVIKLAIMREIELEL